MKDIYKEEELTIPEGVTVDIKSRTIRVKGPRGTLTNDFHHVNMDIQKISAEKIRLVVWHGVRKHVACLRPIASLI
ncbi:60S ribosomal protein L9B, partial [Basidiobolus ranarum]